MATPKKIAMWEGQECTDTSWSTARWRAPKFRDFPKPSCPKWTIADEWGPRNVIVSSWKLQTHGHRTARRPGRREPEFSTRKTKLFFFSFNERSDSRSVDNKLTAPVGGSRAWLRRYGKWAERSASADDADVGFPMPTAACAGT